MKKMIMLKGPAFVVLVLIVVVGSAFGEELQCFTAFQTSTTASGDYYLCAYKNDGNMITVPICTREKYSVSGKTKQYQCRKGSETTTAVRANYKGASMLAVKVTLANKIVDSSKWYQEIGDVGYYPAVLFNSDLEMSNLNVMHNVLTGQRIREEIDAKAKKNALSLLSIAANLMSLDPRLKVIATVLKVLKDVASMSPYTAKDDDHYKFLLFYESVAKIWQKCGSLKVGEVRKCLEAENQPISSTSGDYWIKFTGCNGQKLHGDIYFKVMSGQTKLLTTSDDPVDSLCSKGTVFKYKLKGISSQTRLCFEAWDRDFLVSDDFEGGPVCVSPLKKHNHFRCPLRENGFINIDFDLDTV